MTKILAVAVGLIAIGLLPMEAHARKKPICTKTAQAYQGKCVTDSNGNTRDAAGSRKSGSKPSAPANPSPSSPDSDT